MKNILVFGAGKSSTALIQYLLNGAVEKGWHVNVADANGAAAQAKIGASKHGTAIQLSVQDEEERHSLVQAADIVISLLPPALHIEVAKDCLRFGKHLLTASYVDEAIRQLGDKIQEAKLLFLCEMGLDPGIDHMSALSIINSIRAEGGQITSFRSHCGGLVAPESDDNPWHYKISWNPRNVITAGKAGAIFKENKEWIQWQYEDLFDQKRFVTVPEHELLCWYPNRDSKPYASLYGLDDAATFLRTTLRHPDFMYGWKNVIDLKLTDDAKLYETDGKTLQQFFKEHMELNGFSQWLESKLRQQFESTGILLAELAKLVKMEEEVAELGEEKLEELMMVDSKGDLQNIEIDELKMTAASTLADRMHDANLTLKQLFFLGVDDNETVINLGRCSAADVLQFALEKKLMLQPHDKDLVVMTHEVEYTVGSKKKKTTSTLLVTGDDGIHTAMAETVGLPLGIAAKLILDGTITSRGLKIPVDQEIYLPVLHELHQQGIIFNETTEDIA